MISPYTKEELIDIEKFKQENGEKEDFLRQERDRWNDKVKPLFDIVKDDVKNPSTVRKMIEGTADCLNYRQQINDQINLYLNIRIEKDVKAKMLKADKYICYKTNFQLDFKSMTEINLLIDANLAEMNRGIDIIDSHISFLRDTLKNLESYTYTIKNVIELLNYLQGK